jgi:hypothetical protein
MRLLLAACTCFVAFACTDSGGGRGAADVPDWRVFDARFPGDFTYFDMRSDPADWPDFRRPPADAGVDLGTGGEFPPYLGRLPMGRETMLRWIRARVRTLACVDQVLGERGVQDFHPSGNVWSVQEINLPGRRGRLSVFRREMECDAVAETCLDYLACVGATLEPRCRPPTFNGYLWHVCDGDGSTIMECLEPTSVGLPFDCAQIGGTCELDVPGSDECVFGECPEAGQRCEDANTVLVCTDRGVFTRQECELEASCGRPFGSNLDSRCFRFANTTCSESESVGGHWSARCAAGGPDCNTPGSPAVCEDDETVVSCDILGRLDRLHCPDFWAGSRCVADTGETRGAACTPTRFDCDGIRAECVGDSFEVCVGGVVERIDCAALGMTCGASPDFEGVLFPGCYFPR